MIMETLKKLLEAPLNLISHASNMLQKHKYESMYIQRTTAYHLATVKRTRSSQNIESQLHLIRSSHLR